MYKKIMKKFPSCVRTTKDIRGKIKLFFDFNGLIHTVINESNQYELVDNKVLFKKILMYYQSIVSYIKPELIFVAIDGVCPRMKMYQQRTRRYKSAKESASKGLFNRNEVSPGTEWMKELCEYLRVNLNERVIFYGADVPGEGEHTIFKYIREDKDDDCNYVVYGLDADLIMFSFVAKRRKIYLLRERQSFDKEYKSNEKAYNFLDIDELKKGLVFFTEDYMGVKIQKID